MTGHGTKFGRKKEEAVAALLVQRNLEDAARAVGISAKTLLRWMFGQAVARLQQGASAAATTLLKTMIEPNTPASVRVRAAECVMNHAMKAIEIEDIEARVSELERAAPSKEGRR
ncbi:MAG TPA: hypothetical protein VK335_04535 [Bryobacteraceae bacterium]|nr:hypothetical protein [Bryobacteraceae bacterium]HZW96209.1 hypothetical protein [Candidatus Eremiobacteraceae bacterium]